MLLKLAALAFIGLAACQAPEADGKLRLLEFHRMLSKQALTRCMSSDEHSPNTSSRQKQLCLFLCLSQRNTSVNAQVSNRPNMGRYAMP